jgi:spermidine synthase
MLVAPQSAPRDDRVPVAVGVALVSASLLMSELALTRIFSVTMYYHFAFLAISIALFGLSASGVWVYLRQRRLNPRATRQLVSRQAIVYAATTIAALAFLVRLRVELTYSPANLVLMLSIYLLAAAPFFTGGLVISTAISRLSSSVGLIYGADLVGAAGGCLLLIPLLDWLGAPGVVAAAATFAALASVLLAPLAARARAAGAATAVVAIPLAAQLGGLAPFDVVDTKGHQGDRILFSKWNSFSRVAVYDRGHGDWSLSPAYTGALPETRFMDIDSAASTPILRITGRADDAAYLRYELTALAYHLKQSRPFSALVIGPGGGRDLAAALAFGAARVDGVEINPIIARDVMSGAFREFSGGLYQHPRVRIAIDDGRSFVRRAPDRYDVIQASLVDTWAATAAGAYTLTENTLYTVEAFDDYLDHLTDDGVLTITRWVFDGLRLVSLAQEACARRGWDAAGRLAIIRHERVATFLLKAAPFTAEERRQLQDVTERLSFDVLYLPGSDTPPRRAAGGESDRAGDYAALITAADRDEFYARYPLDIRPTTDDRPFFFHTTRVRDQFHTAFGRSMLFGNGLSALLTLMAISAALVALFVIGPLVVGRRDAPPPGWPRVLAYFGALGAGFMLVEVALLQRFVLLVGHPVYSLTVTLFSLLLGTGIGSFLTRRIETPLLYRRARWSLLGIALTATVAALTLPWIIEAAMPAPRWVRMSVAAALMIPAGVLMGTPLPSLVRLVGADRPALVPWAWGMNGAFSVVGATAAILVAMTWGFSATFLLGGLAYLLALVLLPVP